MNRWYLPILLAGAFLTADAVAHGGTYKGPGDTVPPGGGGAATPSTPAAPSTPNTPSTPSTPSTPATPNTPNTPTTPNAPAAPGARPTTGGGSAGPDLSTWVFWWEFNKDRFLNLKAKVHGKAVETDAGGALTGLGAGAAAANTLAPTSAQLGEMVDALHRLMDAEDDRDIATGAMISMAKIGLQPERAMEVYSKHLDAAVQEVKETAALAYGILGAEGAQELLINLLNNTREGQQLLGTGDVDARTQTFAAYSLALIAHRSKDETFKTGVAKTLFDRLTTDQSAVKDIRIACVIGLGILDLGEPGYYVDALADYLDADKDDQLVLAHVPTAMAKMLRRMPADAPQRERVISQMLGIMEGRPKRDAPIRQSAVQAAGLLARPGDLANNQRLFAALEDRQKNGKDQQVKHYTAISIAYVGAATTDNELRNDIIKFLVDKMEKSSTGYEPWAGLGLGVMAFMMKDGNTAGLPNVAMVATHEKFKDTRSPQFKAAYAVALGLMGYDGAKDDIRESMDDLQDSEFRGYAAISLGLLSAGEYKEYITQVIDDSKRDPDLLKQASIGLGLMKDRNVVDKLLEYLAPKDGTKPRLAVLSAVATALGFIGDRNSVQPLIDTTENDRLTPLGRAFAAVAMGLVGDKEDLPWNSIIAEDLNYRASVSTLVDQSAGTGILDIL